MGVLGFVARSDWRYLLAHAREAGERGLDGRGAHGLNHDHVERTPDVGNYYMASTERGEPAGRWFGTGVDRLGRSGDFILFAEGDEVTADAMERVYGALSNPITGESLGSRPRKFATSDERFEKLKAAALEAAGGVELSEERKQELKFTARTKQREACHYYDLTFSPTKSWSVLYAGLRAAGMNREADVLWECIEDGYKLGLSAAMEQSCYARIGRHSGQLAGRTSGRWEKSSEFVANLWRHHTSRTGDPQLHVHGALLNRVWIEPDPGRGVKGGWYALDGQAVVKVRVEAAAIASRASEALAVERLGLEFVARADGKGREIAGVDSALIEAFSSRRREIEKEAAELAGAYRDKYHREPSAYELRLFAEQATLSTRARKPEHAPSGAELLAVWEAKVRDGLGRELAAVPSAAGVHLAEPVEPGGAEPARAPGAPQLEPGAPVEPNLGEQVSELSQAEWLKAVLPSGAQELVVEQALADVGGRLSVWTRADVAASLDAHLPASVLAELAAADQQRLLDALTRTALAHPDTARVTAAPLHEAPAGWRNPDGRGRYEAPAAYDRYTHAATLAREARLVEAATAKGFPGLALDAVDARLEATTLRPSQRAAVERVLSSERAVDLVIGPAGTGKSYTIAELARLWMECVPGAAGAAPRVLGLATSQAAVRVLGEEGITRGLNVTRFRQNLDRLCGGEPMDDAMRELVTLRAGDLVILDEASMTPTEDVEAVAAAARAAGAKLVLAGDDRQLGAVEAGGVFSLLAERTRPPVLNEVVRFTNVWEGPASLGLRDGDVTAIREYDRRGRITGGTSEELRAEARRGFVADYLTGRDTLVLVPTNEGAAELASHIRGELVALGRVEPGGVSLHNATRAGVGDLVATRHNDRTLDDGCGGWVANRDTWTVAARQANGSLTVRRDLGADDTGQHHFGPDVLLPADYVAQHVELAYACTVHAAQGRTVDTCYALVDDTMSTDALYVALTRARERTLIGVLIERDPIDALGPQDVHREPTTPEAVLAQIIERPREDPSATQVLAAEVDARESLTRLAPEWADLIRSDTQPRYEARLAELLGAEAWAKVAADPAAPALLRGIRAAEIAGRDVDRLLEHAVGRHELDSAESIAQVLHYRVSLDTPAVTRDLTAGGSYLDRTPHLADCGLDRYAKALAAAMDERIGVLGERAAAEPPAWAAVLGPVPEDPLEWAEWTRRAGLVAGYREQHGWVHPTDAIGPAPHRSAAEDRAGWHAAWTVLGCPDEQRDVAAASRGELANAVQAWERTEAVAPANVDEALRDAARTADYCDREARRAHIDAQRLAVTGQDPTAAAAQAEEFARYEAATRAKLAALEEAATVRQAWYEASAAQRRGAELARVELARRQERELARLVGDDTPTAEPGTPNADRDREPVPAAAPALAGPERETDRRAELRAALAQIEAAQAAEREAPEYGWDAIEEPGIDRDRGIEL